jgi:hypothetical protein
MSLPQSAKSAADNLADKDVDSTDTELRYAAYGARLRTALRASQRYLAYVRLFPHFDQRGPVVIIMHSFVPLDQ